MKYDAVIVGAGPSGLAAAARLSHFGTRVCVLEAHHRIGGLNSWYHLGGREISAGLHAFTNYMPGGKGQALGRLLRQLRLKMDFFDFRVQGWSCIRFPSATLRFSNDAELIRAEVAAHFPKSIDAFDALRARIRQTDEGELTLTQSSARAVVREYITDPLLADMLLCPVLYYGSPGGWGGEPPPAGGDMDWLLFCVVWKCIFESGFAAPARGMRPLWEELARRVEADGGTVRTRARVARLHVENGAVRAAELADGATVEGDIFFSSAGALETDALLPAANRSPARQAGTISIAEGICLMDAPAAAAGMPQTTIFYSSSDQLVFGRPQEPVLASGGVVCAPGNYEPHDPDQNYVKVSKLASWPAWNAMDKAAYAVAKRAAADSMATDLGALDIRPAKAQPGAWGLFDDVFTPCTLERYTGHAEGALYGSPVKTRTGATRCANLFLIGADQGFGGIVGAMLSGVAMANMHWLAGRAGA